jgi:hypothetical protein
MAQTIKKTRIVGNPGRRAFGSPKYKKKRPASGHRPRSNFGQIVGFTLGNPGRKGSMAKTKKKRSHGGSHRPKGYGKSAYKRNPGRFGRHSHHTKKYRRHNPGLGQIGPLFTNAVFVIVGAVGSKLGAQMILGSNNVGLVGYAGNAAVGGVLWFVAEKMMKSRQAAVGVLAGTAVQIVLRLINDYTPFGQYISSLGMGDYQMQSFVTPQVLVDPWHSAEVAIPPLWGPSVSQPLAPPASPVVGIMPAGTPMPPAKGTGGLYGGGGWGGGLYL